MVVATTTTAHAYGTPEGALIGWCAAGRPPAAFVSLRTVLRPVAHLLEAVAA